MEKLEQVIEKLQPLLAELRFWEKPEITNLTSDDLWKIMEREEMPSQVCIFLFFLFLVFHRRDVSQISGFSPSMLQNCF